MRAKVSLKRLPISHVCPGNKPEFPNLNIATILDVVTAETLIWKILFSQAPNIQRMMSPSKNCAPKVLISKKLNLPYGEVHSNVSNQEATVLSRAATNMVYICV